MCRVVKSIKNLKFKFRHYLICFFLNLLTAACSRAANKIPREKMFDKDKKIEGGVELFLGRP